MDNCCDYQGNAVVNNTSEFGDYTRMIEHKHFDVGNDEVFKLNYTYVTKEVPIKYVNGRTEPYYPINDNVNMCKLRKYQDMKNHHPNVIFGGRLAEYKYYDMDDVIRSAMEHFKEYIFRLDYLI